MKHICDYLGIGCANGMACGNLPALHLEPGLPAELCWAVEGHFGSGEIVFLGGGEQNGGRSGPGRRQDWQSLLCRILTYLLDQAPLLGPLGCLPGRQVAEIQAFTYAVCLHQHWLGLGCDFKIGLISLNGTALENRAEYSSQGGYWN